MRAATTTKEWISAISEWFKDASPSSPTEVVLGDFFPIEQPAVVEKAAANKNLLGPYAARGRMLLGPYETSSTKIGSGGYAKVTVGKHTTTGEHVAIKWLSGTAVADEGRAASSEAAVVREVAALRRAGCHSNVCRLHDYYRVGSEDAFVMELCRGGELFGLIERQGALTEAHARELFVGLCAGLHHLHSVGIAHRDLKLENVLLGGTENRTPKICDLGLAHVYSRDATGGWANQELTQFCGSRSYCAPEVMARRGYSGYCADVWCLGVCLFGLCSGFFPVDEASTRDWRFERLQHLQHLQPTSSTCLAIFGFYSRACPFTPALVELLDGLLQVQPYRRLELSAALASAWHAGREVAPPPAASAPMPAASSAVLVEVGDPAEELHRGGVVAEGERAAAPPKLCRQRAHSDGVGSLPGSRGESYIYCS